MKASAESRLHQLGSRIAAAEDRLIGCTPFCYELADVDATIETRARRRSHRRSLQWGTCGIAAFASVVVLLGLPLVKSDPPEDLVFRVEEQSVSKIGEGDIVLSPSNSTLTFGLRDGSRVSLDPRTTIRIASLTPAERVLELRDGGARIHINERPGVTWSVVAGPYTVQVLGTQFSLSWRGDSEAFALEAQRGKVRVTGPGLQRALDVNEKDRLELPHRADKLNVVSLSTQPTKVNSKVTPVLSPNGPRRPPERGWRQHLADGDFAQAIASADREGFDQIRRTATARDLLALADAARFANRPQHATKALQSLRKRFAGHDEATAAALELGRLAFDRHRDYYEASMWFRRYLNERPTGPLAREAAGRLIESLAASGATFEAKEAARAYLETYPHGPHARQARSVIGGD